jgi:hypothetical protein
MLIHNHSNRHGSLLIRVLLAVNLSIMLAACGGGSSGVATTGTTSSTTSSGGSSGVATTGTASSTTSSGGGTASGTTTGVMTLQWTAPVARADGTPLSLSEIAGYRVYYGPSPGNYPNAVNITNGSLQSAILKGVPVGTYYVAMSTYDTSGLESNYSAAIVKQSL